MMAMTTSSSIRVKPTRFLGLRLVDVIVSPLLSKNDPEFVHMPRAARRPCGVHFPSHGGDRGGAFARSLNSVPVPPFVYMAAWRTRSTDNAQFQSPPQGSEDSFEI